MSIFDGLANAGISAATGNWISAGIDLAGVGLSAFGGMKASEDAQQAQQIEAGIANTEGQVNTQRENAMFLSANRQGLQNLRTNQQLRAQALSTGTNQNAQFGSGVAGGLSQVSAEGAFNQAGVNQNLQIGQNIFGLDQSISLQKQQLSSVQSSISSDQGLASLGGSISKTGDPLSKLLQQGFPSFGGGASTTMGLNGLPAIS